MALVILFGSSGRAQDSQFYFDPNGNLLVQRAEVVAPPQILAQPQNRIVGSDEAATFSVVAADTRLLSYQWRFNGTNIVGATNDAVLMQNVSTNNEGEYRVVLTNPSGSVTSAPALLMIDGDADDLPDSWERTFFGNLNQNSTADSDGDGNSNATEFFDGTNPTNSASARFRLAIFMEGEGAVGLSPNQPSYTNGETMTLTATPSGTNLFYGWTGDARTTNNPLGLTMTTNKTVRAHFQFLPLDIVWTNLAGGDWHSPSNWNPNLVPGALDNAIIPITATIIVSNAAECFGLVFGSGSGSPTLTGSGTLTVHDNCLWTLGTMSGTGRTILESNTTLNIPRPVTLNTRTLENRGTTLLFNNGGIVMTGGAVVTNCAGALFHFNNESPTFGGGTANGRFDNAGTFRKSSATGTLTMNPGLNFNNYGAVEVQIGTFLCNGGFTNNGTVNVSASATHRLAAGGAASGTFIAQPAALVEWTAGSFTLNAGAQLDGTGTYQINGGTLTANANLTVTNLDLTAGTLNGTGSVMVGSVMNWIGGTMSGSGRTIIPVGVTLKATITGSAGLNGGTLENGGTVLWTGAGNIGFVSSVITNRPGALFHAQGGGGLAFVSGPNRFDNAGTFRKSVNAGTLDISGSGSFNNSGTVEIQTGTLVCNATFNNVGAVQLSNSTTNRIAMGGSATGTFDTPATALVEWTGGTFTLNPGVQLNGMGIYKLNGGTVTANANLTVTNLDLVSGSSTLNGTGAVTIASTMNWTTGTMSGSGRTIIPSGATLQVGSSSGTGLQRTLENGGTVLWTGAGTLGLLNGVITNRIGALFHAQNAAQFFFAGGASRFDNAGTFRKSGSTGTTTIGVTFNNSGTVEIQTGTLLFSGSFNNNNTVSLSAATTNRLAAGGSTTGTFDTPATALVEWTAGTFTLNPGAQLNGAGLYKLNGGTLTANANLTAANLDLVHTSSTLGGTGTVTIASAMTWTAGTMSDSGRTLIFPGAVLNLANQNFITLQRTLENGGAMLWTGAGNLGLLNGVITNRAGALFHIQNAGTLAFSGGNCRIDNSGTFQKSLNPGTATIASGVSFTNSGTVDIRSGILVANGGYNSSSNALLNCALGGTTAGTGYGQLQVAGTVTLNGALSVDLLSGFTPATNDTFTVLTAGTRNGTFASFSYPSNRVTMSLSNAPSTVVLRVTDVFPIPPPVLLTPQLVGSNALLTWTATSNVTYRLENNAEVGSTNWTAVPGDVPGVSNTASKLDALTPSNRFYRVRVMP